MRKDGSCALYANSPAKTPNGLCWGLWRSTLSIFVLICVISNWSGLTKMYQPLRHQQTQLYTCNMSSQHIKSQLMERKRLSQINQGFWKVDRATHLDTAHSLQSHATDCRIPDDRKDRWKSNSVTLSKHRTLSELEKFRTRDVHIVKQVLYLAALAISTLHLLSMVWKVIYMMNNFSENFE